jgi:hypothetical protein
MTLLPNRISAPMTPARELELARGLLGVQSEEELDHFLPLLAAAAPMIGQIAGPLLKNLAGGLFGGGGSKKRRPRDEQEQFFGGIVKGLLGEREAQSYEEEQFIGGILKGVLGGLGGEMESEEENEQEQLLGSLVGKLFGGEMEAPSYEQEQFIGGLLKGVLGGEMEMAAHGDPGPGKMLRRARRFVRLVHTAAQHAAAEIAAMQRAGHRPDEMELRRIILTALVNATRRLKPRLAAAAFGGVQPQPPGPPQAPPPGYGPPGPPPGPQHGETMLESMISEAPPLTAGPFGGGGAFGGGGGFGGGFGGGRHRHHHGTWVRQGDRITITL